MTIKPNPQSIGTGASKLTLRWRSCSPMRTMTEWRRRLRDIAEQAGPSRDSLVTDLKQQGHLHLETY
ncbi:MAG: hypothetical protein GY815_05005 [Gammaproteobacteria bacterium]|nr:hypothetical protein [Gammaproteobacteria bacterium]